MNKPELVIVKYYIGVDLLGQPLFVQHYYYLNTYTKKTHHERKITNKQFRSPRTFNRG